MEPEILDQANARFFVNTAQLGRSRMLGHNVSIPRPVVWWPFRESAEKLRAAHLRISDVGSKDLDIFNGGIAYGMAAALKVVLVYKCHCFAE
jgi:hypothetical protein